MEIKKEDVNRMLRDVVRFAAVGSGIRLRGYQVEVARAIVESVLERRGDSIVVVFPRQSGKNELQAQVEAYLLTLFMKIEAEMVKASPTYKPQTQNAMRRLERVLKRCWVTRGRWQKESGYIYRMGKASVAFLSGEVTSNVVGATANALLACDEAQDVQRAKWDKDFAPMAASTNATRVFWGTAWTSQTLLARELRTALEMERRDGRRRAFVLTAEEVRKEVPAYGKFVDEQITKLGRNHPLVRTQYFSEEIEAEGGMFPPERQALMQGRHERREGPEEGRIYCLLLDVAGEDENISDLELGIDNLKNTSRDSTALTVVEVDLSTVEDELIGAPRYRVVKRYEWVGRKHTELYGRVKALAEHWGARYLVVDATGVGAGLASFLERGLPGRVIPYVFTAKSKSDLGWGFLAVIETGRYKEYLVSSVMCQVSCVKNGVSSVRCQVQEAFWRQVAHCESRVMEGPGKQMRWGVPDGKRDEDTGELVHDDLLVSAAMCWVLDGLAWGRAESKVIRGVDPIEGMREIF